MELDRAKNLFVEASGRFPASATAQSAHIALICLQEQDSLDGLTLLLDDSDKLIEIADIARHAHTRIPLNRPLPNVDQYEVKKILREEIRRAQILLDAHLSIADLQEIARMNAEIRARDGEKRNEKTYRESVEARFGIKFAVQRG